MFFVIKKNSNAKDLWPFLSNLAHDYPTKTIGEMAQNIQEYQNQYAQYIHNDNQNNN